MIVNSTQWTGWWWRTLQTVSRDFHPEDAAARHALSSSGQPTRVFFFISWVWCVTMAMHLSTYHWPMMIQREIEWTLMCRCVLFSWYTMLWKHVTLNCFNKTSMSETPYIHYLPLFWQIGHSDRTIKRTCSSTSLADDACWTTAGHSMFDSNGYSQTYAWSLDYLWLVWCHHQCPHTCTQWIRWPFGWMSSPLAFRNVVAHPSYTCPSWKSSRRTFPARSRTCWACWWTTAHQPCHSTNHRRGLCQTTTTRPCPRWWTFFVRHDRDLNSLHHQNTYILHLPTGPDSLMPQFYKPVRNASNKKRAVRSTSHCRNVWCWL